MAEKSMILKSEVIGLDLLLRGGFQLPPSVDQKEEQLGLLLLIRGKPGTGKTTLALQIADASVNWDFPNIKPLKDFKSKYYTLDQSKDDIDDKLRKIREEKEINGKKDVENIIKDRFEIESYVDNYPSKSDSEKPFGHAPYSIDAALKVLSDLEEIKNTNGWYRNLTVVDGLNCLGTRDIRNTLELSYLIHLLRETSRMSILVYEPTEHEDTFVEYLIDMTIDLRGEVEAGRINYFFHSMSITKSRYQATALGWHKFKIRDHGIEVYPSIHFHVHRKDYMEEQFAESQNPIFKRREKEGKPVAISGIKDSGEEECDEAIITRILREIKRGSSTVLFGPRRTYKSQLTMDFLRAGSKKEKHSLLLSLMDNQATILQEAACQRLTCGDYPKSQGGCRVCFDKVFLFFLRPGCISPEEFFHFLKKRLDYAKERGENIRRLVFWDLTQLEYRFPLLSGDPMFLPALMDFLKQYEDEPSEFYEKEFKEEQTNEEKTKEKSTKIKELCSAIVEERYDLTSMKNAENSVKWLNTLLEETKLYDKLLDKLNTKISQKKDLKLPENYEVLISKTKESRKLLFTELTNEGDKRTIKRFNRMLLEIIYDKLCPKKIGVTSLFMAAANTKLSAAASAMADNVIFCWRDSIDTYNKKRIPDSFINNILKKENGNKKDMEKELRNTKDFLVIYVDRAEGIIGMKQRSIFCFPIVNDNSCLKDRIPLQDFALKVEPFRTEDFDWLKMATEELERIDRLQGVPR